MASRARGGYRGHDGVPAVFIQAWALARARRLRAEAGRRARRIADRGDGWIAETNRKMEAFRNRQTLFLSRGSGQAGKGAGNRIGVQRQARRQALINSPAEAYNGEGSTGAA